MTASPTCWPGLVQEADRRTLRGIPGILRLPIIKQLFSSNDTATEQADVIVLLTPRIVRTHEITQRDIDPLFIGTPLNLGLGNPTLLAPPPAPQAAAPGAVPPATAAAGAGHNAVLGRGTRSTRSNARFGHTCGRRCTRGGQSGLPPTPRDSQLRRWPGLRRRMQCRLAARSCSRRRRSTCAFGNGALAVPIVVTDVARLSSTTLTITYNPAVLRVAAVQQGNFMSRPGGAVAFTEDHARPGRIDVVLLRTNDVTGASGSGPLAYVLFDAITAGPTNFTITGHYDRARRHAVARAVRIAAKCHREMTTRLHSTGRRLRADGADGYTFVELLVVASILVVLASVVMPLAQTTARRVHEAELRTALREMRSAIDRFKDAVDAGAIASTELEPNSEGYPGDLQTLVDGVPAANDASGRKVRFGLRRMPIDPMTNSTEWGWVVSGQA